MSPDPVKVKVTIPAPPPAPPKIIIPPVVVVTPKVTSPDVEVKVTTPVKEEPKK